LFVWIVFFYVLFVWIVFFYVLFVSIVFFYVLFMSIVFFYVLFVCKCVLYYCHRMSAQFQLTNISYHMKCENQLFALSCLSVCPPANTEELGFQ